MTGDNVLIQNVFQQLGFPPSRCAYDVGVGGAGSIIHPQPPQLEKVCCSQGGFLALCTKQHRRCPICSSIVVLLGLTFHLTRPLHRGEGGVSFPYLGGFINWETSSSGLSLEAMMGPPSQLTHHLPPSPLTNVLLISTPVVTLLQHTSPSYTRNLVGNKLAELPFLATFLPMWRHVS